ncbi:MAG: DUF2236 domain-containing protein [Thermoleophilaceae bacterium]|nr:DUF2236 domain-containing protein [Thermoleophilaceae bacterium]
MAAEGYFPAGTSVLRRVHSERAVGLLYGQRALAIGALAPLNFIGTLNHTRGRATPFERLTRTGKMFETIFFGSRDEADRVLAAVHGMHDRVNGVLAEGSGAHPAGTPYSAHDPELMLWTIAVAADSARTFYELLVGPLTESERDAFWADYVRFGELFGMPREVAPGSHAQFREYFRGRIESSEAHLSADARRLSVAIMFQIPVPAPNAPAMQLHNLLIRGSLPPRVREIFGLSWTPAHVLGFNATVAAVRASRPIVPVALRRGKNTSFFNQVRDTERRRHARGEPIPGALAVAAD